MSETEKELSALIWINKSIDAKSAQLVRAQRIGVPAGASTKALENQIAKEIKALERERKKILKMIMLVSDDSARLILELRFVNGKTMNEIAEAVGYGKRQTIRIKLAAIEEITRKMSPNVTR